MYQRSNLVFFIRSGGNSVSEIRFIYQSRITFFSNETDRGLLKYISYCACCAEAELKSSGASAESNVDKEHCSGNMEGKWDKECK